MLETVFRTVVEVTLASSVVITLLLLLSKILTKHFTAKWRYWVWLIIAIRLALPVNFTFVIPPVQLPATEIVNELVTLVSSNQSDLRLNTQSESTKESDNSRELTPGLAAEPLSGSPIRMTDIIWILWIAGSSLFISWHLMSYVLFLKRIRLNCKTVRQQDIINSYKDLCNEMKIKQQIPLMTSSLINSPVVLGIWRHQLFLPDIDFTPQQLRMIFRHELTHIQRRDILYKILILLVRAIHWFNPLVHLMAKEANKAVEASCDTAVVANQDIDYRKDYSKTILLVITNSRSSQVAFSSHFGGGKIMIMKRFENLFDTRKKRKGIIPVILLILAIGIMGLCISCNPKTDLTTVETKNVSDPKLLGRWIEETPADVIGLPVDSIELLTDGTAIVAGQYNGTYKLADGKLQCKFNNESYSGKYEINGTKLTIFKDNGESKVYLNQASLVGIDPKLLGKWTEEKAMVIIGLPVESIEFFIDGKAIIAGQYNGTYKIADGKLQCMFDNESYAGKYEISGTKLTIFKDNGESKVYLKK